MQNGKARIPFLFGLLFLAAIACVLLLINADTDKSDVAEPPVERGTTIAAKTGEAPDSGTNATPSTEDQGSSPRQDDPPIHTTESENPKDGDASISGRVMDEEGNPLEAELTTISAGRGHIKTKSNKEGYFRLKGLLPETSYFVFANCQGYLQQEKKLVPTG